MIVELLIATGLVYGYNYIKDTKIREYKNNFKDIMESIGLKNKKGDTFEIQDIDKTSYGYRGKINIPNGLSIDMLESKINILQDNLNGIVVINKDKFKEGINIRIVNKDIDKYIYEPVKSKEYELYIGKLFTTDNYKIDLNKDSQVLIGGCTGTGKTMLLSIILTNLIYNSSDMVELYLFQITKSELSAFEECKCIHGVAFNIIDSMGLIKKIKEDINTRSNLFKDNGIRNITQWNKHYPKNKMKREIVVIEELSFYMNYEEIFEDIIGIAKAGRSVGIHIISCIQRSTASNLPPDLKSQMSRITFRQKSTIDSVNIINTSDAKNLGVRECIFDGNGDYVHVKTPYIDDDFTILHKYVKEIKIPKKENKVIKTFHKQQASIDNNILIDEKNKQVKMMDVHGLMEAKIVEEEVKNKKYDKNYGVISMEEFNAKRKR